MNRGNFKKLILKAVAICLSLALGAGCVTTQLSKISTVNAEVSESTEYSTTIFDENTVWTYYDGETDPAGDSTSDDYDAQAWARIDYDDSSWKTGSGAFGAKKGVIADLGNGYIPDVLLTQYYEGTSTNIPTFFFRGTLTIDNLDEFLENLNSITGTIYYDDGVVIYLNGTQIAMYPDETYESNMSYGGSNGSAPMEQSLSFSIDSIKDYFVEGKNIIAVELHNRNSSSSDIYFEMASLVANYGGDTSIVQKSINLTVGSDETEKSITWYSNSQETGQLQICKYAELINGEFPDSGYTTIDVEAQTSNNSGYYYFQTTISDLEENTKYAYCLVNEDVISEIYSFETQDFDGSYNFIFAGDPQIGSGSTDTDTEGWAATLEASVNMFDPDFLLSAGDQVDTAANEDHYDGYLEHDELTSVAEATTIGNHDTGSSSYSQHFNLPNVTSYGTTNAGSDYYYVYNNTLFMVLNSNSTSTSEHKTFMEDAILATADEDIQWKVVVFHHSIYSVASHATEASILQLRENLVPVLESLDIDVVLMGHDHVYVRSNMMLNFEVDTDTSELSSVTNPDGILYVTANSASGSKYYNIQTNVDFEYAAVMDQSKQRSISNVEVSDNEFKITTYNYDTDSGEWYQIDEFSIIKTDTTELEALVSEVGTITNTDGTYTSATYSVFATALEAANTVLNNENATQDEIDSAYTTLQAAYIALIETADTTELEGLIATVSTISNVDNTYTSESYNIFVTALNAANTVLSNESATQDEVDSALATLQAAFDALTLTATTEELESLVSSLETITNDDSTYTTQSYNTFIAALNAANTVLNNESATQDEIDNAYTTLQAAFDALTLTATIEELETLVSTLGTITNSDNTYTTESYNAYITALNAANTVLNNENATQDEINSALAALQAAYDALSETSTSDSGDSTDSTDSADSSDTNSTTNTSNSISSTTTSTSTVQTSDNTNALAATILLFTAAGCIVMLRKKKKAE